MTKAQDNIHEEPVDRKYIKIKIYKNLRTKKYMKQPVGLVVIAVNKLRGAFMPLIVRSKINGLFISFSPRASAER